MIEPTSAPLLFPFENKDDWLALIGRVLWLSHCLKVGRKLEAVGALHLALQLVRQFEAAITDPASASSWRPDREFRDVVRRSVCRKCARENKAGDESARPPGRTVID